MMGFLVLVRSPQLSLPRDVKKLTLVTAHCSPEMVPFGYAQDPVQVSPSPL
jgi:hypothetical protein